ncbi:hypothetical protein [Methanobrevibacter sp.]|uniref:hypothetical protein n=1 Tax=Methanobrevibacter sp. TaxID=66852 RepID=UPI00386876CB
MNFTEKDKELVRKFINIKKRGLYVESTQLTEAYNRILDKNVRNTTCGSCMRARIAELETALNKWEADEAKEAASKAADTNERGEKGETESVPLESIKEEIKEETENADNRKSPKTKGRKTKQKNLEREEG